MPDREQALFTWGRAVGHPVPVAVTTTLVRLTRQTQPYSDRTRQYRVLLDGHEVARLKWAQTLELAVEPGEHVMRLKIDWTGSPELPFTIEPGEVLTLSCRPARPAAFALVSLIESIRRRDRWLVLERV